MLKILLFVLGAVAGGTGATSWLLSEPDTSSAPALPVGNEAMQARWQELRGRVQEAIAEGQRAGNQTEQRLRRELDAYRNGQRPASA